MDGSKVIPWPCLRLYSHDSRSCDDERTLVKEAPIAALSKKNQQHVFKNKTYMQVFKHQICGIQNAFETPMNSLPCLKGDVLAIKILEEEYQVGVAICKNILDGHPFLSKGDHPYQFKNLRAKLVNLWKISNG